MLARPIYVRRRSISPHEDWHLPTLTKREAAVDLIIVVVFAGAIGMVGGEFLVGVLISWLEPGLLKQQVPTFPLWAMQLAKGFWLIMVLGVAYFICRLRGLSLVVFGWPMKRDTLKKHSVATLIALVAVGVAWAFSAVVAVGLLMLFPHMFEEVMADKSQALGIIPRGTWYEMAVLMGTVGLQEELLFRGMLLPYLRKLSGSWLIAVMISCAVFAVLHFPQGTLAIIQIEFLALAFAIVYIKTRSMIAVVFAHFLFNFLQIVLILPAVEYSMGAAEQAAVF